MRREVEEDGIKRNAGREESRDGDDEVRKRRSVTECRDCDWEMRSPEK
jgi:hypothetical protein